jgi:hydroxyethylthiazole kinase-like uncharacterized protein yjeF
MLRVWGGSDSARFVRVPGMADDKRTRGIVGLRTGSIRYPGAAVLSVEGAWRAGAGFVRYVGCAADQVLARRPETVIGADENVRVDAWVIGSGTDGTGRSYDEERTLRRILRGDEPVAVDAGGLDLLHDATAPVVITPHAGEFTRLRERLGWETPKATTDEERHAQAAEVATALTCTVLLKGARTLVCAPDGEAVVVAEGPGWLATAGAGDVLAGALGALLAANPDAAPAEVAASAAWLHGRAAAIAAGCENGGAGHPIVALDVADALPYAVAGLLG